MSTNDPTSWSWSFSGGTPATSNGSNPTITYSTAGVYNVTLTVQNADGTDTESKTGYIVVNVVPAPIADFIADNTSVDAGGSVTFSDQSSNSPVSWYWEFDGGSPATSTAKNPKVTYANANSYKVKLTVTNPGGSNTKIKENYVQVNPVIVVPSYCSSNGTASAEWIAGVKVDSKSHNSGAGDYEDFTSTIFTMETGKTYPVALTPGFVSRSGFEYWSVWIDLNNDFDFDDAGEMVFSSNKSRNAVSGYITIPGGMSATTTRMRVSMASQAPEACGYIGDGEVEDYTVKITEPVPQPPVADFTSNYSSVQVGGSVSFTDLSLNEPDQYQWTFEGGTPSTSTQQNPVVVYNVIGNHQVTLTVSKSGFTSSTKTGTISVTETTPVYYCTPTQINSSSNYIQKIVVGSFINNNTGADGYSLQTSVVSMTAGSTYSVALVPNNSSARNFWRIWIDFNGDKDFDDSDETLAVLNNKKGSVATTITIPNYVSGSTRMRISMKNGSSPATCDDAFDGEVEDYLVSFGPALPQSMMASAGAPDYTTNYNLVIYPNPINETLNIRVNDFETGDYYSIFNVNGEKVKGNSITGDITKLDMSDVPAGLYLITVFNNNQTFHNKIIKR